MKYALNLIILLATAGLAYLLYYNIKEPIDFRTEKDLRLRAVGDKLGDIRTCQEIYRDITGKFAGSFDSLSYVLKNDSIPFEQVFEDPEFPGDESKFIYKMVYSSAKDSLTNMGIDLNTLADVPYAEGSKFAIDADTMTYQKTLVSVTEVSTRFKEFMGIYASPRYAKFDNTYDPNKMVKFGDMGKPVLTGNWE